MPILAALIARWFAWIASAGSTIGFYLITVSWARRLAIATLGVVFLAAVSTCVSALLGALSGSGLPSKFLMGVGVFIPSNAVAVMSCVASVWLACVVYRLKLTALQW